MKIGKGMIGLAAFALGLWALVVSTYASTINTGPGSKDAGVLIPMQNASCSSSTSTSGGE